MRLSVALLAGTCLASTAPAFAQEQAPAAEAAEVAAQPANPPANNEIVVTGTLVRGIAPPGASVVSVSEEAIEATGATSVNDVLESIPQLGSFGTLQQPLGNSQEVSVNRPNLRNLPGFNTSGGSTTLVLLDGHRVVGMGTATTTPDPDIIPPGVLQRVEVVPDGGSAIYGSDAVAGVLNFITIKRFDGVKVDAKYGFADDFYRYDANVTAGRDWGAGSIYISYNYAKNGDLLGKDRDYIRDFPDPRLGVTSLNCSPGNILDLNTTNPLAPTPAQRLIGLTSANTGVVGRPNECDATDFASILPAQRRHSMFAGLTQELNDTITFEVRGFYTNRKTTIQNGPYTFSEIITPFANPVVPSTPTTRALPFLIPNADPRLTRFFAQQVSGRIGPDNAAQTEIELDTWGITPTVTADLGENFQLRVLGSYGESVSNFRGDAVNQTALRNAIRAGLFNPYDPGTASPETVAAITDYQSYGRTKQYFHDVRAIVDGDLFELPGGAAKIAVGLEYFGEEFDTQRGDTVPGFQNTGFGGRSINGVPVIQATKALRRANLSRNVKSAFGELVVPVFGEPNRTGGLHSLTVSAAGRYDDYSDVGSTFNPRLGLTYKPVEWLSIFGAWGKSFNAPSLADAAEADNSTIFVLSGSGAAFFAPPRGLTNVPAYDGGQIIGVRGNAPDIQPQKATTWNVGFDIQPPFIEGLNIGATYYNIKFNNQIGLPPFENPTELYNNFLPVITFRPSQGRIDEVLAGADIINGTTPVQASQVYALFDGRRRNLGEFKLDGVDFRAAYERDVSFGSVFLNVNGTYELNRERSVGAGAAFVDVLSDNTNRFRVRSTLGARVGALLGQVTWNHLKGYDLNPAVGFAGTTFGGETFVAQSEVEDFNTFDLFFRYELAELGMAENVALTLNVENVFNTDPPEFRGTDNLAGRRGTANGNTLGRLVQFGISTKF